MAPMTLLVLPSLDLYDSWAACVAEYEPGMLHGSGMWNLPDGLQTDTDRDTCEALVALLRRLGRPSGDRVPSDYWWIAEGDEVVGFLAIRHRLDDWLLEVGGHIGYSVRPSRRRQGHATRALGLALERSRELGIDRALVTCDDDNVASARTIESQGGVLEDVREDKRRYWIALT
jgi:predicted acetyltransferase